VVQAFTPLFGGGNKNRKVVLHPLLAHEFGKGSGAQSLVAFIVTGGCFWMD
jgi:hypothetical protein